MNDITTAAVPVTAGQLAEEFRRRGLAMLDIASLTSRYRRDLNAGTTPATENA